MEKVGFHSVNMALPRQSFGTKMAFEEQNSAPKPQNNSQILEYSLASLAAVGSALIIGSALRKGAAAKLLAAKNEGIKAGELETLKRLKNLDIADFKKVGSFDKGKALIDGKPYSGVINTKNSVITYKDGVLTRAEISDGTLKTYNDGHINRIRKGNQIKDFYTRNDGTKVARTFVPNDSLMISKGSRTEKRREFATYIKPDGSVLKTKESWGTISHPAYKNGEVFNYHKVVDQKTGKTISMTSSRPNRFADTSVRHKEHVIVDGKKVTNYYHDGKITATQRSEYNPGTGVVTIKEKTYNFDGKPYDGEHLTLKLPKTEAKLRAFVEKDGKIKDGSVELFDQKGHQLVGDSYMNHGGSVAEARAAIEKAGLPFRI